MSAISLTGSEAENIMKRRLDNEQSYQISMSFAKKFLNEGTITEEDYREFDTKMRQKYKPTFGTLFTDLSLDKCLL